MPKKTTPAETWNYEATVATVEGIIADLESGSLPLATVLSQFEQAVQALQQCETYLHEKQQQVDLLIETLADS
ncbi:exodeoxyribonuclease VII small subunit [filamentous cyanobacterium CCT1]|nr:exodeoxyribonuclease VII small subunit [filamentous cyanobacterium CCT1]PSN80846.1 exodeoxyribonuclease VII small subunit [filamentous cyanobacterium CCP4]